MPYSIGSTGITVAPQSELVTNLTSSYQLIYGSSINLASNTPDGQWMMIFIQTIIDVQNLLVQIYNMFDPDNAVGVILDQRVAINGIQRQAGTYTLTNVTLVMAQSVNLYGLNQTAQPVFTVQDNAGNQWQLQTSQLGVSGTQTYAFQAANPGAVQSTPNTITIPVTIVIGVTSINNPSTYTTLGIAQETDAALRIRRAQSVSLASQGYYAGLLAALQNINGVTSAFVYENLTNATNIYGVPSHSIWVIVAGTGAAASIAQAIYTKRNAGCGMYGSVSYTITQVDGSSFVVYYDTVVAQNLFIAFTATSINGTTLPNIAGIRAGLPLNYVPAVYAEVNITALGTQVQAIDPNTLVTNAGFSSGLTQTLGFSAAPGSGTFVLNYNGNPTAAINWNDPASTIQTKLQAVTGLSAATVTGSIASQSLVISLNVNSALGLLTVTSNSLGVTVTNNPGYTTTLLPSSLKNQFSVTSANIIITPMIMSPVSATVAPLGTQTFAALGGYGAITFTLQTNASGGSINSSSGIYTAGSTPNVTDVVLATDSLGNTVTANVTVT